MSLAALLALVALPLLAALVGWAVGRRGERQRSQRREAEAGRRQAEAVAAEEARLRAAWLEVSRVADRIGADLRRGDVPHALDLALGVRDREPGDRAGLAGGALPRAADPLARPGGGDAPPGGR